MKPLRKVEWPSWRPTNNNTTAAQNDTTYYRKNSLTVNSDWRNNYELYLARTLSVIITLAVIILTFVRLTARHVAMTCHTAWEPVVAERTRVTTAATIALNTGTLTAGQITLAGWWPYSTAVTWLQPETNNIVSYCNMQTAFSVSYTGCAGVIRALKNPFFVSRRTSCYWRRTTCSVKEDKVCPPSLSSKQY